MRLLLLLTLTTVFFMAGCKHSRKELAKQPGIDVFFETISIQKERGNCAGEKGSCAQVLMRFPLAKKGDPALVRAINDTLLTYLIQQLTLKNPAGPPTLAQLNTAAEAYLSEWRETNRSMAGIWQFTAEGKVVMQTAKVAVVYISIRSCSGGTMPGTSTAAFNFDLKTGKTLRLDDFITQVPSLRNLLEHKWGKSNLGTPWSAAMPAFSFVSGCYGLQLDGIHFWPENNHCPARGNPLILSYEELGPLVRREKIF